jgi:serine phosphatase RsbU (regulator of sigma subunit)
MAKSNVKFRFTIGWRMAIGFGFFTLAVVALFVQTRLLLGESRVIGERIDTELVPSIEAIEELDRALGEARGSIKYWMTVQSRSDDAEKRSLKTYISQTIPYNISKLKDMNPTWESEIKAQLDSLNSDIEKLFLVYEDIMRLLPDFSSYDNPIAMMDAEYYALEGSDLPFYDNRIRKRLSLLSSAQTSSLRAATTQMEHLGDKLSFFAGSVSIAVIIFGIIVGLALTRSILVPVHHLKQALLFMGRGQQPKNQVPITPDEIGDMAVAVNRLSEGLKKTRKFSEAVGSGDFNAPYEPLSVDDSLGYALLSMRDDLATTERELEQKVEDRTSEMFKQKQRAEVLYSDLRDSINYALRIQTSILPTEKEISEVFDNSSVFYRPRDIVSGDFYFFRSVGRIRLVAAVDCTGHGVPGAFMSLVGYNSLSHVTKVFTEPSKILDRLNSAALEVLSSETSPDHLQDGMDLVMVAVDMEKMQLQYSGANNPLYVVRQGELHEMKADKFAIASFIPDSKSYTQQVFSLKLGDTIFASTDGFVDQFGGPFGKKYMRRRFRKLLIRLAEMPVNKHRAELAKEFDTWKAKEEQVDDVLVVSIRI